MKKRILETKIRDFAGKYPVVTIVGPRQSGKTTLVRDTFANYRYVNLESLTEREYAQSDPVSFLNRFSSSCVILDEVQRVPHILSQIQVMVDEEKRNGRFILTGSQNFALMRGITQSLAGRTALCTLLPFSIGEIADEAGSLGLSEMMWRGFYPKIHDMSLNPTDELAFYVSTYLERDVRAIEKLRNLRSFSVFLRLAAGRTGQVLNVASLAADAGISPKTASEWLSILEASFVVKLLEPWYANINKRLVKAPKLYFLDVGLACYLMGVTSPEQLDVHPLRGELFETMIVGEFLKNRANRCSHEQIHYYRDSNRNEIDLVVQTGRQTILCEIKSGATFSGDWLGPINRLSEQFGGEVSRWVVYGGNETQRRSGFDLISWRDLPDELSKIGQGS